MIRARLLTSFFCLGALLLASAAASAQARCLDERSAGETVTGRLAVVNAIDANGRRERPYILTPRQPACLTAASADENVASARRIHVYATQPDIRAALARQVNRAVTVTGRPFAAHTAHHHAPIVMEVARVERAGPGR